MKFGCEDVNQMLLFGVETQLEKLSKMEDPLLVMKEKKEMFIVKVTKTLKKIVFFCLAFAVMFAILPAKAAVADMTPVYRVEGRLTPNMPEWVFEYIPGIQL